MRHDSIEFGFADAKARARRTARTRSRDRVVAKTMSNLPPAAVIDEAIAGFVGIDSDAALGTEANTTSDWRPMGKSLVASLAAQLDALDRQREQLARLLRDIDSASITE